MITMKAVRIHEYGKPDVLRYEDVPRPQVGPGQVLIKVRAAGMNPLDWKVRSGLVPVWPAEDLPQILGFDMAGDIVEVGSDVTQFAVGDAVYGFTDSGGYAEYTIALVDDIAFKPRTVDYIHAAAMPGAAVTSWQALIDSAQLTAGQTVLIHGAAGGVGTFAVQIAKCRGARVIVTASAHNHDFLQQLGADELIDYNTTRFEDVVSNIDMVLDTVGKETLERSWRVIKPGGKIRTIVDDTNPETAFNIQLPAPTVLTELARLVDTGQVKPIVSTVLPLSEVQQAHRLSEGRHVRGKIVLVV